MARPPDLKRLAKEDFPQDDQELVGKLAFPINAFFEQVRNALNKNLNFDNLNQEIITLTVTVVSGIPTMKTQFKSNIKGNVQGIIVVYASNLTTPGMYPTSCPFITSAQNGGLVTINHISGLQDNQEYRLKLLTIGS